MKKTFEVKEVCPSCSGTGLYVGMGERSGAAVVCYNCNGTGCHTFRHEYEEFNKRAKRNSIRRVYQANPGICIGEGNGFKLSDFGGISFEDWEAGMPFGSGTENRKFTCPCWWYQTTDYKKKPDWKECCSMGAFSHCEHFKNKEKCWKRFDKENNIK